ncbi:MAG TPA: 4-hydroxyphenylpyruvate dioxygenase [Candidatus Angelobacter sp.]
MAAAATAQVLSTPKKPAVELKNYDYVQLYVGNAYQSMQFFRTVWGFVPVAYAGLETGMRNHISYVLAQGNVRLVVTSPLDPSSRMAHDVRLHGDAVREVAFTVRDSAEVFNAALLRGACPIAEPATTEDEFGQLTQATISSPSHVIHTFIERNDYHGVFLPGYQALPVSGEAQPACLTDLDHVALSLPAGQLDQATEYYTNVLDLEVKHEENIVTPRSAMNSKVVENSNSTVRFPMMEPGEGKHKSQIEEYLKYNQGPGVQHLAFSCTDIIDSARRLNHNGAQFLATPKTYYDLLPNRVGGLDEEIAILRDLNILADRDEWGYLLQIFSKPVAGRPTLFLELIQRHGARGFGSGNIRALFDAVEREQALRGNL